MYEVKFVLLMTPVSQPDETLGQEALAGVLRDTVPGALEAKDAKFAVVWGGQPRDDDHLIAEAHEVFGPPLVELDAAAHTFTSYDVQDALGSFGAGSKMLVVREKGPPAVGLSPAMTLLTRPMPLPTSRPAARPPDKPLTRFQIPLALTVLASGFLFASMEPKAMANLLAVAWACASLYLLDPNPKLVPARAWIAGLGAAALFGMWWAGCPYPTLPFWELPWLELDIIFDTPGPELLFWQVVWPGVFVLAIRGAVNADA